MIPLFFAGLYLGSNREGIRRWFWSLTAVAALAGIFVAVVLLAIPGFFRGTR
ncbi:MAG: hypothetical protein V1798_07795 [Pseudomonadota bacterium]